MTHIFVTGLQLTWFGQPFLCLTRDEGGEGCNPTQLVGQNDSVACSPKNHVKDAHKAVANRQNLLLAAFAVKNGCVCVREIIFS